MDEIIPITKQKVPTIVAYDVASKLYLIGERARSSGLKGKTTVFNFKPGFGKGDKEFTTEKNYWYWSQGPDNKEFIQTFSAKEAGIIFLRNLLSQVKLPEKVIIGEPPISDKTWRDNFRRHIRDLFAEIGFGSPEFFPEPFAVFQYYRHVMKIFPVVKKPELILIVDFGGSTFSSCVIRTTEQGLLSRGGATAVPLGLQAEEFGGAQIDRRLLKTVIEKASKSGVVWKEDPFKRIDSGESSALLHIEDAKIKLSQNFSNLKNTPLAHVYEDIKVAVNLSRGELHPEAEIKAELTGEDLKNVIREMWRRHYGEIISKTMNEARAAVEKQKISFDGLSRILVAGGSSRLPFIKEELELVLRPRIDKRRIHIAEESGEAVAFGIACECREQFKRDPKLSVGRMAPFMLKDLYIAFRQTRRHPLELPKIKQNGKNLNPGQLLASPFLTEEATFRFEFDLPFDAKDRLFYMFSDKAFGEDENSTPLNVLDDVLSLQGKGTVSRKCELELTLKANGMIKPSFVFRGKGVFAKAPFTVSCPEFYYDTLQTSEGTRFLGIDFGNSNSYVVEFFNVPKEITSADYPEFTIESKAKERLRELEESISALKTAGIFTSESVLKRAREQQIEVIFHSNKIEGSPLTLGETEEVIASGLPEANSEPELQAKNLDIAYLWMLENLKGCITHPEMFIRQLNKLILTDISNVAGQYRHAQVEVSGMDFKPPLAASVAAFMQKLGEEITQGRVDRSAIEFATSMHTKLVHIHPFLDGNGRCARLLLNALLLVHDLPGIIINYADRERYLDCLKKSNGGDLTPLVDFVIECFNDEIEELSTQYSKPKAEYLQASIPSESRSSLKDPLEAAMEQTGIQPITDPLDLVMQQKVKQYKEIEEAEYEKWKGGYLSIAAEIKAISANYNEKYNSAGYSLRLFQYDLLPIEKFSSLSLGKSTSRTWFLGIEILGPTIRERMLLFFNSSSILIRKQYRSCTVSLALGRYDGVRYQRLTTEPIRLREIGYANGEMLFVNSDDTIEKGQSKLKLREFLAEIIRSYDAGPV